MGHSCQDARASTNYCNRETRNMLAIGGCLVSYGNAQKIIYIIIV